MRLLLLYTAAAAEEQEEADEREREYRRCSGRSDDQVTSEGLEHLK